MPRKWTDEQRKAQSERISQQKPWLHSTGPRSEDGKKKVRTNSYKHGMRSEKAIELRHLLSLQNSFLKALRNRNF